MHVLEYYFLSVHQGTHYLYVQTPVFSFQWPYEHLKCWHPQSWFKRLKLSARSKNLIPSGEYFATSSDHSNLHFLGLCWRLLKSGTLLLLLGIIFSTASFLFFLAPLPFFFCGWVFCFGFCFGVFGVFFVDWLVWAWVFFFVWLCVSFCFVLFSVAETWRFCWTLALQGWDPAGAGATVRFFLGQQWLKLCTEMLINRETSSWLFSLTSKKCSTSFT